jgi:hypothetical protein
LGLSLKGEGFYIETKGVAPLLNSLLSNRKSVFIRGCAPLKLPGNVVIYPP